MVPRIHSSGSSRCPENKAIRTVTTRNSETSLIFPRERGYYRLTPFEVAVNWVHGLFDIVPAKPDRRVPRKVLGDLLVPALSEPPCYVAFSGGRDSSAVLAVATAVARAEGFDDPIPVTERYPDAPDTDETSWQELVIGELRIRRWIRLDFRDENDFLGLTAREGLVRRGVVWPPTLHSKENLLRALSPGTLVTGEGGDEVFGWRRAGPWPHLSQRTPVSRQVAMRDVALSLLPAKARAARIVAQTRRQELQPWLRPDAARRHLQLFAADMASEPLGWGRSLQWLTRRRGAAEGAGNYRLLAAEHGLRVIEPLLDPQFLASLGSFAGRWGFASRTEAMRVLFGDLLPAPLIQRHHKAAFNQAFFGRATQSFAQSWKGSGVDHGLVDADRLREEWLSLHPSSLSSALLQSAWLATQPAVPS